MNEEELYDEEIEEQLEEDENKKRRKANNKKTKHKKKVKVKKIHGKTKIKKEVVYCDRNHPVLIFILVIIIIALVGVLGYLVYVNYYNKDVNQEVPNIYQPEAEEKLEEKMTENEALELGNTLYKQAYNLYIGQGNFELNTANTITCDELTCIEISNFDNSSDNVFTSNGKKEFGKNSPAIKNISSTYYLVSEFSVNFTSYSNTTLDVIKIENDEITFDAIASYCVVNEEINSCTDELTTENKKFVIKKKNGNWLVDEFTYPIK